MKYSIIGLAVFAVAMLLVFADPIKKFVVEVGHKANDICFGYLTRIGAVTPLVTLLRPYGGYSAGQTVGFTASTEAALIASGQAVNGTTITPGNLTTNQPAGVCAIAAAASSVTITNPLVTSQSRIHAVIAQATADTTLLYVARIVATNGGFTIHGNANATAQVAVDWAILQQGQSNPN